MNCYRCVCVNCKNYECEYHCKDLNEQEKKECHMDIFNSCDNFKS